MAVKKYLDDNGLTYYHSKVKTLLGNKVDKEAGKGLSTNDYSTEEKNKLANIAAGAEVNVQSDWNVSDTNADSYIKNKPKTTAVKKVTATLDPGQHVDNITVAGDGVSTLPMALPTGKTEDGTAWSYIDAKGNEIYAGKYEYDIEGSFYHDRTRLAKFADLPAVNNAALTIQKNGTTVASFTANSATATTANITVPTDNNELTNGAGYQNATEVQALINDALEDITGVDYQKVDVLPATGEKGVIYLVPNSGGAPNIYDEYIWLSSSSSFEKIGTTDIDLSGYQLSAELIAVTNAEIDTIVAN